MTVVSDVSQVTFTGIVDGVPLTFNYPVLVDTHLVVTYGAADTVATEGVDYSVALAVDYSTASITPLAGFAALSGGTIVVSRDPPEVQTLQVLTLGTIATSKLIQGLDYLTMLVQAIRDKSVRTMRYPKSEDPAGIGTLPSKANRASKFLAFDVDSKPIAALGATSTGTPLTAFGVAWNALADAGAGVTALGFSAYMAGLKATASLGALQTALGMSAFFKTILGPADAAALRTSIGAAASGSYIGAVRLQVFPATGTYTPHANMVFALLGTIAPGGGGGGAANSGGGNQLTGAGGGGAGSLSLKLATLAQITPSKAVTIAAAGAAAAAGNNAGGNGGGDTSIGTLCISKSGTGGGGAASNTFGRGGLGGVAGTGDITGTGEPGTNGVGMGTAGATTGTGGNGGSSLLGGGGRGSVAQGAGEAASGVGSGGGGGCSVGGGGDAAGGIGTIGFAFVLEFCTA